VYCPIFREGYKTGKASSRVNNNPDKQKSQTKYIEALETKGIKIYYGHNQSGNTECSRCGNIWATYSEKMTDVKIVTQIIIDAYNNSNDMAMLISGDSDLVPPIKSIHENFKTKEFLLRFRQNDIILQ